MRELTQYLALAVCWYLIGGQVSLMVYVWRHRPAFRTYSSVAEAFRAGMSGCGEIVARMVAWPVYLVRWWRS